MDRTTKALLFAIALGLWANAATDWLRPVPVSAQQSDPILAGEIRNMSSKLADLRQLQSIDNKLSSLSTIDSNLSAAAADLARIQRGQCSNEKLC